MNNKQGEKDLAYLNKMYKSIIEDLKRWRDIIAIMWSINRTTEWWKNKLKELEKEFWPKPKEKTLEEKEFDLKHKEFMNKIDLKLNYMIRNWISPFDNMPKEITINPLW
jgi:hypothetical protein